MATYYSGSSNGYTLRVDITEGTQAQNPPSTTVNYSIYLITTNMSFDGIVEHGYLDLNGVRVWTAPGSYNFTDRYYETIHLKSGSYSVDHDPQAGTKTMTIESSFSATSGGWGPGLMEIETSQALTPITVWTPVTAPSTILVGGASSGKREIIPGTSVGISWSGHAGGTSNAIQSYTLQYSSGAGWVTWKTGLTTASYSGAMPNNTRGAYFYFRVIVVGTKNSATSGQSEDYVINNVLPSAPTVSLNKSGTVPSTTASAVATFSGTVYYSTSSGGPKTKINSGATLALNNGSNTFYFWGWDGLEYSSSSTNRTVVRNVKPTLTLNSVAISGTPPTLNGYSNSDYPFAHDVKTTVTPSKGSGTLKFYALKAGSTGSLGSASSIHLRNQTVTSTGAHTLDTNLLSYLTDPIFGQYVRIGVVFNDGIENSNTYWQTNGLYLGHAPTYLGFYNRGHADSNVTDSDPDHFYRELRIKHSVNSKVSQYRILYGPTNSEVTGTVPGTLVIGSGYTSVRSIPVGIFTPGTTYYFWLQVSYPNGSTTRIGPWSKTQVPNFPFDNPTISSSVVAPIKNPSSTTFISFTKKELVDFSVKEDSVSDGSIFKLEFRHSDKSRVIATTATMDVDSFDFSPTHQITYPFDLDKTTSSGSHNPFNLKVNEVHRNAFFRVTVTNAFGVAYTKDFGPVSLDLKNDLAFYTGNATISYSKDGTTWTPTLASPAPILFERERLRFSYPRAVSPVGTPLKYEIIEVRPQGKVVRATVNVNATGTAPAPATNLHTQILPRIDVTETVTYQVRVTDPKGQQAVKDFTGSVTKAQHIPVVATLDEYVFGEGEGSDSVDLTILHLGGGVNGVHLKKVDIDLETSTLSDFLPIKETIVLKANLQQSNTTPTIPNLDGTHTSWIPASDVDFGADDLLFFRLKFTTYPDTEGGLAQPLVSYSPYVTLYNEAPTLSWRKNWVGVNTKHEGVDEVFTISETSTKNLLVLKGANSTITIDLSTGTIDGITIDGGSW